MKRFVVGLLALVVLGFATVAFGYQTQPEGNAKKPVPQAQWKNGCCDKSDQCQGDLVCKKPPKGWEDCSSQFKSYCVSPKNGGKGKKSSEKP